MSYSAVIQLLQHLGPAREKIFPHLSWNAAHILAGRHEPVEQVVVGASVGGVGAHGTKVIVKPAVTTADLEELITVCGVGDESRGLPGFRLSLDAAVVAAARAEVRDT